MAQATRVVVWLVASTALVLHAFPGHEGLVVAEQAVLKEGSVPFSFYFNHDKVLVASALFGIAHFPGGVAFVLVATGAGLLYGLVYLWTGRLVWAVLVHWGLNLTHLLLFTYPVSV